MNMALTYHIENDILVIECTGNWDIFEMKLILHSAVRKLAGQRVKGVLLDERNSLFAGCDDDVFDMARLRKRFSDPLGKKMAVCVSDDLNFGQARTVAAIHVIYGIDLVPFRDREKAAMWLRDEAAPAGAGSVNGFPLPV
jgi:hypothetical protein